jgi:Xaa-Pro aminopeptidase
MTPDRFAPRLDRLRAVLAGHGCAAMLIDHAELLAWISGYTVSQTLYRAAVVPLVGAPCFVLRAIDAGPCRAATWFSDVIAFADDADPYAAVADVLGTRGLAAGRIGVDRDSYGFTAATQDRLHRLLPSAAFVDLGPVSDTLRACKFPDEVATLRGAAAIADATMAVLETEVRPGSRVRDAAAIAATAMLRLGADDGGPGPVLRGGGDIVFLHGSGLDHRLVDGDVLHVELTPRVDLYGARLMRPIPIGPLAPEARRVAERLVELQDAQIAAMRPGASAAAVDAVLRQAVLREGLRETYPNVTGYTLGLYGRTPRSSDFSRCFHPKADFALAADMVFHMYVSARGLAFSETVLVGADGPERLTCHPRIPFQRP